MSQWFSCSILYPTYGFVVLWSSLIIILLSRGFEFIWNYLTQEDVQCYWEKLLLQYSLLMTWEISEQPDFINVT